MKSAMHGILIEWAIVGSSNLGIHQSGAVECFFVGDDIRLIHGGQKYYLSEQNFPDDSFGIVSLEDYLLGLSLRPD